MPFKSEAQRRFLYATNPEVAEKFSKHTKKGKDLPERVKRKTAGTATKTDPEKWEQAKRDAKARMGGKHSARAMQLATQLYKKRGGGYSGSKPTAKSNSLKKWTKQKWKWSGGSKDKGVYLPSAKVERLKSSKEGKKKLRAAGRKKSKATREGRQYSRHGLAANTSLKKTGSLKMNALEKYVAKTKLAHLLMEKLAEPSRGQADLLQKPTTIKMKPRQPQQAEIISPSKAAARVGRLAGKAKSWWQKNKNYNLWRIGEKSGPLRGSSTGKKLARGLYNAALTGTALGASAAIPMGAAGVAQRLVGSGAKRIGPIPSGANVPKGRKGKGWRMYPDSLKRTQYYSNQ